MGSKVLIIGTVPLPIGGVTIHVKRLLQHLARKSYSMSFIDYKRNTWKELIFNLFKVDLVHLHCSSPLYRLAIVLLSKFFVKKVILTIHGDLGRFNILLNQIDFLAIKLANKVFVLNEGSKLLAVRYNKKVILMSAFIPPVTIDQLDEVTKKQIESVKNQKLYCTNCYNLSFDKNGNEIYGISNLVKIFIDLAHAKLIVSDPSGNYKNYLEEKLKLKVDHVIWITKPHDFISVIKLSDAIIRNTTTDGDALTIHEGLYYGKIVLATSIVSRPLGTTVYDSEEELKQELLSTRTNELLTLYKPHDVIEDVLTHYP